MERLLKLALLEAADNPNILLDSKKLGERLGVSDRQARIYRRLLFEQNYFVIFENPEGKNVILTKKALNILNEYYQKLQKLAHVFILN